MAIHKFLFYRLIDALFWIALASVAILLVAILTSGGFTEGYQLILPFLSINVITGMYWFFFFFIFLFPVFYSVTFPIFYTTRWVEINKESLEIWAQPRNLKKSFPKDLVCSLTINPNQSVIIVCGRLLSRYGLLLYPVAQSEHDHFVSRFTASFPNAKINQRSWVHFFGKLFLYFLFCLLVVKLKQMTSDYILTQLDSSKVSTIGRILFNRAYDYCLILTTLIIMACRLALERHGICIGDLMIRRLKTSGS